MAVPKGKKAKSPKPPRPTPKAPQGATPNDYSTQRAQPAQKGQRGTRPSPTAREVSLGAPTTEPFRLAPSGKPRKGKGRKEEPPMPRPPPLCPRWVSHPNSA